MLLLLLLLSSSVYGLQLERNHHQQSQEKPFLSPIPIVAAAQMLTWDLRSYQNKTCADKFSSRGVNFYVQNQFKKQINMFGISSRQGVTLGQDGGVLAPGSVSRFYFQSTEQVPNKVYPVLTWELPERRRLFIHVENRRFSYDQFITGKNITQYHVGCWIQLHSISIKGLEILHHDIKAIHDTYYEFPSTAFAKMFKMKELCFGVRYEARQFYRPSVRKECSVLEIGLVITDDMSKCKL